MTLKLIKDGINCKFEFDPITYYRNNALYDLIRKKRLTNFLFSVGDSWQIIYGDNFCNPLLIIFAKGLSAKEYNDDLANEDLKIIALLTLIAKQTNLPFGIVKFRNDLQEIQEVQYASSDMLFRKITLQGLSGLFGKFGLPVSNTQTAKYLNDETSSAYHSWQRQSLGKKITVSDIDLWRINKSSKPEIIFELKRSYYDLEKWQPFADDYTNFRLIWSLCNKISIKFKIVYNVRTKEPFNDDISKIKLFEVDFNTYPPIKDKGIISVEEFLL